MRGRALFLLGYREDAAKDYSQAEGDLRAALATNFSLSDFADYYLASAQEAQNESGAAAATLEGFARRYAQSALRTEALALFAQASAESGRPEAAIQAVEAEPQANERTDLILLLAQAYQRAGRLEEAAKTFQEVYYKFPTAQEAGAAGAALDELEIQMGEGKYPAPPIGLQWSRAETLFRHREYSGALNAYDSLLSKNPSEPQAPLWKTRRARCLVQLHRDSEALDSLEESFPNNPQADAERLGILAIAYFRRDDAVAADVVINQLRSLYADSGAYADALFAGGDAFVRRGDWSTAANYYAPLAASFPKSEEGEEASWRVAWNSYLEHDLTKSREAFFNFISQYPASPHVPAGLYWLARVEEMGAQPGQAEELYQLLISRCALSYYANEARARLEGPRPGPAGAKTKVGDSAGVSLAEALAKKIPPLAPAPGFACAPEEQDELLRAYSTLRSLNLDDLAEDDLRELLKIRNAQPDLLLALSKLEYDHGHYLESVLDAQRAVPDFFDYQLSAFPADFWRMLFPRAYWRLVNLDSRARSLDPYLIMGLIREESAFNPRARSVANARGLMQLLPGTARRQARSRSAARYLYNPAYNLRLGTGYIGALIRNYKGNLEEGVAAYHAGQNRVDEWLSARTFREPAEFMESIPIPSTRAYVEKVLRDAQIYRRLITGSAAFKRCE